MLRNSQPTERSTTHDAEIAGIDALEIPIEPHPSWAQRVWSGTWPVLAAVVLFFAGWQAIVLTGWKPEYALPGPVAVLRELTTDLGDYMNAARITVLRALLGYAFAFVVGSIVGLVGVGIRSVRVASAAMITGLQTMPSIVWFPLTILIFGFEESAILAVVILGAAPSVANGLIGAVDHIPPILVSAGKVLGARRFSMYRHVLIPAAIPSFVGGMKQGWAFAWRSLMAGEIVVSIAQRRSLGFVMHQNQVVSDAAGLMAGMVVVFLIGVLVDRLVFTRLERAIRTRWGLTES